MATVVSEPAAKPPRPAGELSTTAVWMNVLAAVVAYIATNPSRAYGLSPITEVLLKDFDLSRTAFGQINFWATMIVAVLSVGFGTLVDRMGSRWSFVVIVTLLAGATALMALARNVVMLFVTITLARLLGQGILALVSTSLLGRSVTRGIPLMAAVYFVLASALYMAVLQATKDGMDPKGMAMSWREVWLVTSGVMFCVAVPVGVFAVTEPSVPKVDHAAPPDPGSADKTLWQALRSPVFIVFGAYTLVTALSGTGIALFNESLFKDRGFSRNVFFESLQVGMASMLVFKFLAAWLCQRWSMGKVNALAMLLSGVSLAAVPLLETETHVYLWSIAKGLAMSVYVVTYFSIWGYAFGRRDLAQIQGAAHVITVTASGIGPWLFGYYRDQFGTYIPCIQFFAVCAIVLGVCMWFVPVPCAERPAERESA